MAKLVLEIALYAICLISLNYAGIKSSDGTSFNAHNSMLRNHILPTGHKPCSGRLMDVLFRSVRRKLLRNDL